MIRCVRCTNELSALTVFCPRCQHPNEPDFKQLIHQTLGNRFQLYRQLGEGGLSTVFAAIDLQTDKTVVVKVSDPRHLTQTQFHSDAERLEARQYWAEMTERMQREVAALTNVHHPNIVKVLAAGTISADLSYVVMELLRGKTLREELNGRHQLPVNEAVSLAVEVAIGLRAIHAHGIVHRDLTPRNIFLLQKDERGGLKDEIPTFTSSFVKLIDFGIAKFPKPPGAQTYTQHAVMAGTPGYASPEQFQNLPVDHRSDIYSLGVVLYEMVTGEKPFAGRSATEIALKQMRADPVRPRVLVPDLPMRLEALILRALAKDPAVRQQSADELAAELKTISARIEVPLFAPPAPSPIEPSGTEVFTLLSDLAVKAEAQPASTEVLPALMENNASAAVAQEIAPPRRSRWLVMAAGLALLFVVATWLWARQSSSSPPQSAQMEVATTSSPATPTPTLRAEVTVPSAEALDANRQEPDFKTQRQLEKVPASSAALIQKSAKTPVVIPVSKPPATRPTATPTPAVVAVHVPPPASIRVEPTPSPAPPPARPEPREATSEPAESNNRPYENDGWKRTPTRPWPQRPTPTPTPAAESPRRVEPLPDPKVITWQGHVNGWREVTLEMPGVPGMLDVPRSFRKKVGVVEPPSPGNGWRRAVLRVFGKGEVSLVVRWWPHRDARLNWTRLR
jgi:serine/threonine protein kinase